MKRVLLIFSILGLVLTVIPSFLAFWDVISLTTNKTLMLVGAILWFTTAPFLRGKVN